jgi:hypothetical protein
LQYYPIDIMKGNIYTTQSKIWKIKKSSQSSGTSIYTIMK